MIDLLFLIFGVLFLIFGVMSSKTKNEKMLKMFVKRKPDETDEDYFQRGFKVSLLCGAALIGAFVVFWFL